YPTPSGRIEFYSQRAVRRGLLPFPAYSSLKGDYPLQLLSPTYRMTTTSQYHNTYGIIDPHLYINPKDAGERGINEGDTVEVYNRFGRIKTTIKLTEDVPGGVVLLYKAFWISKLGWNVNVLTTDETIENYGNASSYHSTWVNIRKV
ncbi:MAG TPA: dehydrogenase, partial [Thermococcus paralvinellae]|nr:dehydrogenase [Thermococcus paralvinellae]